VLWLVVVLGVLAAVLARVTMNPDTVPMLPLSPAQSSQAQSSQAQMLPLPPATGTTPRSGPSLVEGDPAARTEVKVPGATPRNACVAVRVEQVLAGRTRCLSDVDVELHTADAVMSARTSDSGETEFECKGGDGQSAQLTCALGAAATVTMEANKRAIVVLTIRPRVIVRGTVVDATGAHVADAAIVVMPWNGTGTESPFPSRVGSSAADGSYEVGLGTGGRVGAVHRVYGPSAMYSVPATAVVASPPIVTMPLVLLSLPGQLSGVVRDAHRSPVAGAEIEFRSAGKPPPGAELAAVPQRVRSDAEGRYLATRLLPGAIAYGARARGHGPRHGTLQLEVGRAVQFDVELLPPCELIGSVRSADDAPVAGATVQVGTDDAFLVARTKTAADGTFRLLDLAPGQAALAAGLPHAAGTPLQRATAVLDLRADTRNEWHAVLSSEDEPGNLRGRLLTAQRRALAGWRVVVRPAGGGQDVTVTAVDGAFRFNIRPSTKFEPPAHQLADLRAYAPGRGVAGFADAVLRGVDIGAGAVDFLVPATANGRLVARVVANDHTGIPASVGCWHHERAEYFRFEAREDGTVQRDDVPPGTIDVLFEHPGHASASRRERVVVADGTLDLGEVVLGAGGTLFGSVHGPGGMVPDACELSVLAQEGGESQRFVADYNAGTFRFPTLPAGAHTLLVQAPGLAAWRFQVTVEEGVNKQQDVELLVGVARRIRITVPAEAPRVVGFMLRVPGAECQWLASPAVPGDPAAAREVELTAWMSPGTYEAVAWATGGWKVLDAVRFAPGVDDEVRLVLRQQ
jgi:hypothetical protein